MVQYNQDRYYDVTDAGEYAGVAAGARVAFIRKTYAHLLGAVLLWVALVGAIINVPALSNMVIGMWNISPWIIFGLYFVGSMVAQAMANSRSSQGVQYLGLGLFALIQAIVFAPLLFFLTSWQGGTEIISQAGILTLVIFGGLTTIVMLTKKDFSFMRNFLWMASLAAFGLIIASMFGAITLGTWFVVGMIVLMSGLILYDTSNVLHHYHESQYVAASLHLFSSLATLFWYALQLSRR